jgi:hypothetical protein
MRVLRRIGDSVRFGHTDESELRVRQRLLQPSVDCIMIRKRIQYVSRLLRNDPKPLCSFLASTRNGRVLPWVSQVRNDFEVARKVSNFASAYGPLHEDWKSWQGILLSTSTTQKLVDEIFFCESINDRSHTDTSTTGAFECAECKVSFSTAKGLDQHRRVRHDERCQLSSYILDSVCPCCKIDFNNRVRA